MAGSSVYGAGYYKGSKEGHQEGLEDGLAIGALGVLFLAGAAYGVKIGVDKLKDFMGARHEKKLLALENPEVPQPDSEGRDADSGR